MCDQNDEQSESGDSEQEDDEESGEENQTGPDNPEYYTKLMVSYSANHNCSRRHFDVYVPTIQRMVERAYCVNPVQLSVKNGGKGI